MFLKHVFQYTLDLYKEQMFCFQPGCFLMFCQIQPCMFLKCSLRFLKVNREFNGSINLHEL